MKKVSGLLPILFYLLCVISVKGQNTEAALPADTLVVRFYKNDGRLKWEEIYHKGTMVAVKNWYYTKEFYGYLMEIHTERPMKRIWIREFYSDGGIRIDGSTIKGKKSGPYKTYFQNGSPQCNCNYKEGRQDNVQQIYFDNGQLWTERIYNAGKIWTVVSNFDRSGKPLETGTLKEGNGTLYIYNEMGLLSNVEYYENGKLKKSISPIKG